MWQPDLESLVSVASQIGEHTDLALLEEPSGVDQVLSKLISISISSGTSVDPGNLQKVLGFLIAAVRSLAASTQKNADELGQAEARLLTATKSMMGSIPPALEAGPSLASIFEAMQAHFEPVTDALRTDMDAGLASAEEAGQGLRAGLSATAERTAATDARANEMGEKLSAEIAELRQKAEETASALASAQFGGIPPPAPAGPATAELELLKGVLHTTQGEVAAIQEGLSEFLRRCARQPFRLPSPIGTAG